MYLWMTDEIIIIINDPINEKVLCESESCRAQDKCMLMIFFSVIIVKESFGDF